MKKRRALLRILLALLLVVGIPAGLLVHAYRQERLNRDLIDALYPGDTDEILAALKSGADPSARDYIRRPTSLRKKLQSLFSQILDRHTSSKAGCPVAILMYFGERCPPEIAPENWGHYGYTLPRDTTELKALLEYGADPNASNAMQQTPLMLAARDTDENSVRLLLQYGAHVNTVSKEGKTALDFVRENHDSASDIREQFRKHTEQILLQAGAKIGKELSYHSATSQER